MLKVKSQCYVGRSTQSKIYILCLICLIVVLAYFIRFPSRYDTRKFIPAPQKSEIQITEKFQGERIVHIDLKGAPPKISYYKDLFPLLATLGATGVLMEYEDMFPYSGSLINVSALNAYTLQDIKLINKLANEHNLKVIPLIPTFGHTEFILKLFEYKDYREVPEYPQVFCPTFKGTVNLVEAILGEIIKAHDNSQYIHIGADEVYYLGMCDLCNTLMIEENLTKNQLFIRYVNNIISIIKRLKPSLRILMWDDQLRSFSEEDLKLGNFNSNVEPVIWKYTKDVYDDLGPSLWNNYRKVFKKVWVASAFKGATGSNQVVSEVTHYLENHRSWMYVMSEYQDMFEFQGIIITGWQRYDHFAVLCELLPVGLPTLAMCLRLVLGYNDSPLSPPIHIAKLLKCEHPYALIGPVFGSPKCSFPGGDILEYIIHFQQLKQEFEEIGKLSKVKGWMRDYNVANCFSNTNFVESATASLTRIRSDLSVLSSDLAVALAMVYDKYTVEEWMETYFKPLETQVEKMWNVRKKLLEKRFWNRRPFKCHLE